VHREEKYRSRGRPWDMISVLSNNIHEMPMDHTANWYFTNWVDPDAQLGGAVGNSQSNLVSHNVDLI